MWALLRIQVHEAKGGQCRFKHGADSRGELQGALRKGIVMIPRTPHINLIRCLDSWAWVVPRRKGERPAPTTFQIRLTGRAIRGGVMGASCWGMLHVTMTPLKGPTQNLIEPFMPAALAGVLSPVWGYIILYYSRV